MPQCVPSGWLALELDHGTVDPVRLSDAELIDTVVGFERVAAWAGARLSSSTPMARSPAPLPPGTPTPAGPTTTAPIPSRNRPLATAELALGTIRSIPTPLPSDPQAA